MLASIAALADPQVYGESLMVKVRPDTPPTAPAPVKLLAGRNEAVSFQVVIHADGAAISQATAHMDDLQGPGRIGQDRILLYREEFLNVVQPSSGPSAPGPWPDPLIPAVDEVLNEPRNAFPFDVPAGESRAIWVDIYVPDDAPPGDYQSAVTWQTAGGFTGTVPVTLTVVDATLPSTPSYPTAFEIDARLVCQAHTNTLDCGSTDVRANLVALYGRLALDHRFTLSNVFVLQPQGGRWDAFDALYGPMLDGTAPTRLHGARMTTAQYTGPLDPAAIQDFAAHFTAHGWLARAFDYTADEPPLFSTWDQVQTRGTLLGQAAPGLVRMVTTTLDKAEAQKVDGLIDRLAVLIQLVPQYPEVDPSRAAYSQFLQRPGTSLWMYQSCSSHGCMGGLPPANLWPSYMVDHPAELNRAMPWLVFLQKAAGESYYQTVARLPTAWSDQQHYGGNGDGTLFYPGTPNRIGGTSDVPLPSIRLKLLRAGIQDYEWLQIVAKTDPAFADQVARSLIPAPNAVTADPAAFENARAQLIGHVGQSGNAKQGSTSDTQKWSPLGCSCSDGAGQLVLLSVVAGGAWMMRRRRRPT